MAVEAGFEPARGRINSPVPYQLGYSTMWAGWEAETRTRFRCFQNNDANPSNTSQFNLGGTSYTPPVLIIERIGVWEVCCHEMVDSLMPCLGQSRPARQGRRED